ncbi:MAG: mandelate racemase/muconate lactonizing enzyme family protein [Pseudomonadota bacterium]
MRITAIEDLHCDAGWRVWSFLKVSTDEGITGWAEYNESYGSKGLSAVIGKLGEVLIGRDPRPVERISAELYARTRQAPGGINQQAIAAIENALIDIKARALGIPVYELLGGPCRERLRLYWSHCGSYRCQHHEVMGTKPLKSLEDVKDLGAEVAERGFTALKQNLYLFDRDQPAMWMPGFTATPGWPELNVDRDIQGRIDRQLTAFRDGTGPDVDLLLDMNFNFKAEGYRKIAQVCDTHDLMWMEMDMFDPQAMAMVRSGAKTPIASCESLFGRREFRPYLEHRSMDVAIVDVPWNGILESMKIAAMAEAYETNCAPHNFYGNLCTAHSAHFCAAIANFRIMEIDIDDVPWKDEVVTPPVIEDGYLHLTDAPGWGVEVNEEAIRAHPPKR